MAIQLKKITPHLWFDKNAKQAAAFYVSIFPSSKITSERTLSNTPSGDVEMISFELSGMPFMALSAGPMFKFNESVSFLISCDTQEEIDFYWNKLSEGGQEQQCGWLKDKFGLSWQVVPTQLGEMMQQGTKEQTMRVTQAFLKMKKFNLSELQNAFNEK